MRCFLPTLALALLLTPLVEAEVVVSPQVDAAFASYAALPGKLVPVLEQAQSKETADAAAPALQELLPQVYDSRSALHAIASLSPEETQQVQRKYEQQLRREWGKLFEQIFRLQKAQCYGSVPFLRQFRTLCLMLEK